MFEAIVLAGGKGTRLKSVSGEIPKPMVPVAGKPFIYWILEKLEAEGASKVILAVGYNADYIIDAITKDNPVGIELEFVKEEEPLGTGGALVNAAKSISSDHFLVLNGDSFIDINFLDFFGKSLSCDVMIAGVVVTDASRYGTILVDEEDNILSLLEKGVTGEGLINSGVYSLKKDVLQNFKSNPFSFEAEFLAVFRGSFKVCKVEGYFIDIGIPDDYHRAREYFEMSQIY